MKQSNFLRADGFFHGSNIVRKYTFKTTHTRDNCALLASANHHLAMIFAVSGEKSALFHTKDCFECLSPHKKAA